VALPTADILPALPPDAPPPPSSRKRRRRPRFLSNRKAVIGMALFGFFCLLAVFGPMFEPYDPGKRGDQLLIGPSADHWFGTTHLGQDLFSQMLDGSRSVMLVGLVAGVVATALGVLIGVTSGYLSGLG
jgi:peptide/nickel transport system permease protein